MLKKVAKDITLTNNGETTSVRPSVRLISHRYTFQTREHMWMNPTILCLRQMLSDEYHCGPFRPKVTNTRSQRLLGLFTSRIKILFAKRFAIIQTAPTHCFTTALQQPTYRHITIHTHTHNKLLLLKIYYLTLIFV